MNGKGCGTVSINKVPIGTIDLNGIGTIPDPRLDLDMGIDIELNSLENVQHRLHCRLTMDFASANSI